MLRLGLLCVAVLVMLARLGVCSVNKQPKIKLNNGREMPAIALGTYLGFDQNGVIKSKDHLVRNVVTKAIEVGYRHFDTASIYETENEVGEAINMKIADGSVTRDEIFITTKLWNTHHKRAQVAAALRESLERLGMNYVDLYLMHWPIGLNEDYTHSNVDYMETWRGLEDVQKLGLAKSIGLSNFNQRQIQRIMKGSIKPVALEIEVHPQNVQTELVELAQAEDIVVLAYSPLGSLVSRYGMDLQPPRIDDPVLVEIAKKYNKTTPQVVLRWLIDRNIVPLPKTTNLTRLEENINVFDFKLEKDEINKINSFDKRIRYTLPSFWQSHPYYPFEKVDNPIANPFIKQE